MTEAQELKPSLANILRFGTGKRGAGVFQNSFSYLENLADIRLGIGSDFAAGIRFLYDDPPETGFPFQGVKRRYAEYTGKPVSVRVGHFSHLLGRGLALNLFENRGLAYDTWIDGVRLEGVAGPVAITGLAGRLPFRDSVTVTRDEEYALRALDAELEVMEGVNVGGSLVHAEGTLNRMIGTTTVVSEVYAGRGSVSTGPLDVYLEWSVRRTDVSGRPAVDASTGLYGSLSWADEGFGVSLEYKDYRFDIQDPYARFDGSRPTRMLPFQNPPTVMREHSFALLSRPLRQVNFDDEVGIQADLFLALGPSTTITANTSVASEHDYFDLAPDGFAFLRSGRPGAFLPSSDRRLSPAGEMYLELEHYGSPSSAFRLGFARRTSVQTSFFLGPGNDHTIRSIVIPAQAEFPVGGGSIMMVQAEQEWVDDNYSSDRHFFNQALFLTVIRAPLLSAAVRFEWTTNPDDPSFRTTWTSAEIGIRAGGGHAITLTAGQERGGLVCSNGICRFVQPFSGIRVRVQSSM
jgi:hypothetical protein